MREKAISGMMSAARWKGTDTEERISHLKEVDQITTLLGRLRQLSGKDETH